MMYAYTCSGKGCMALALECPPPLLPRMETRIVIVACMYVCMNECIYVNKKVCKHYYHFSIKPMRYCMWKAHTSRLKHGGATQDKWAEQRNADIAERPVCLYVCMYENEYVYYTMYV